jgi:hypothetical protein
MILESDTQGVRAIVALHLAGIPAVRVLEFD